MQRWTAGVAVVWVLVFSGLALGALHAIRIVDQPGFSDDAWAVLALGYAAVGLIAVLWQLARDGRRARALVVRAGRLTDAFTELRDELAIGSKRVEPTGIEEAVQLARPLLDDLREVGEAAAARELATSIAGLLRQVRGPDAIGDRPRQGADDP